LKQKEIKPTKKRRTKKTVGKAVEKNMS